MSHRPALWLPFAACLAIVLAAMAWVSFTAVRAARSEVAAQRRAVAEETMRLALWRLDTALAPLLAEENARPYFAFRAFFPAGAEMGEIGDAIPSKDQSLLVPSPLLSGPPPLVLLHFQIGPDGRITSPQSPTEAELRLAVPTYISRQQAETAARRLTEFSDILDRDKLTGTLPRRDLKPLETAAPADYRQQSRVAMNSANNKKGDKAQREYALRNEVLAQNTTAYMQTQQVRQPVQPALSVSPRPASRYDTSGMLMTPMWLEGRLALVRRFSIDGREYLQGCVLDWPAIKASLVQGIADLLPEADLLPVSSDVAGNESRRLAALPVLLAPGKTADEAATVPAPLLISLSLAWACVLLAAAAVAFLLWGIVRLSERRAAFVSAVSHELRTPLTTFQMYAEMLSNGMVSDETSRRQYLETLRAEAVRLTHMVENVLAYARLERGRTAGRIETVRFDQLIEPIAGRLSDRAAQAGMSLVVEGLDACGEAFVRANRSAVEQALFNLIDNACKYASTAADRRIHLVAAIVERWAEIAVVDHGPGLSPMMRCRLFRSFSKTSEEAAASAPGIGLGLALSRRLARDMGGDLRFEETAASAGAKFVLRLPVGMMIED